MTRVQDPALNQFPGHPETGRTPATLTSWRWPLAAALMNAIVFVADILSAPAFPVRALHPLALLWCLRSPSGWHTVAVSAWASILVVLPLWIAPTDKAPPGHLFHVSAALITLIWLVAAFLHQYTTRARTTVAAQIKELNDLKFAIDKSTIVVLTDTAGVIRYVNDRFCELSGYRREELIGRTHRVVNSGYHPKAFFRDLWHTIIDGDVWQGEIRNRNKDGSLRWFDTTIVPFLDESGRPYQYMAFRYDVSRRKAQEDLLREQTSLARLGEMAAVVAHEVKNPLAGIRGALQVIGTRLPADGRDRAVVHDIVARLDSLNELVQDLLLFARPRDPRKASVPVAPLLESTVLLLRRDPEVAGIEVDLAGADAIVSADPELLQTVFLNLLLNAAQAMGGHGRVSVEATTREGATSIVFSDTGPGMPQDVLERIFEPFYTTKHRGTGLGLPTARRLIELHGGRIDAECPPGGGTSVTVTLPAPGPAGAAGAA